MLIFLVNTRMYLAKSLVYLSQDRLQYFEYESVSFHCEGTHGSTQLRRDTKVLTPSSGFSYTIDKAYSIDSGEYWCETKGEERSNSVNITITGTVIVFPNAFIQCINCYFSVVVFGFYFYEFCNLKMKYFIAMVYHPDQGNHYLPGCFWSVSP
uniref:Immunoglobulin subtype domain-containing protein n=1 Tax=Seriola lalandi dorsalis TaxID=1841481 RepID=A0A3B4WI32_SERLL